MSQPQCAAGNHTRLPAARRVDKEGGEPVTYRPRNHFDQAPWVSMDGRRRYCDYATKETR